jgi:hypothetical protein
MTAREYNVRLRTPHAKQELFIESSAKRKVIRAGRRGGKTVGIAIYAVKRFLEGKRILYATPTQDQIDRFWFEVKRALEQPLEAGVYAKNETRHIIERAGTENRIRAKTAWNADTLRGDYADELILDEWQLMNEDAWELVGAPMMLDTNGNATFIYTPPSLRSAGVTKAKDPMHAAKLFKKAESDTTGRWATFHFSSLENPRLSREALDEIANDMTQFAYEQEILALDKDDNPRALWKREQIEKLRVAGYPELERVAVAIDPTGTKKGDEVGIVGAGIGLCNCKGSSELHGFILDDSSLHGSPHEWAMASVASYNRLKADCLIAESNFGGEMVEHTIGTIHGAPPVKLIHASRGKVIRAEPISALYEKGKVHHVGYFGKLETELCMWDTSHKESPNRLDSLVWVMTELMLGDFFQPQDEDSDLGKALLDR